MDRRNPAAAESQSTLASLQQLDPSPIESPFEEIEKPLPDIPFEEPETPPVKRAPSFGLGLSGSGHGAVYYLTRLQRYSSYVFTAYTVAHLTNTSIIPLITRSVPASEPYLLLTRPFYQSFPLEPLLITLPLATHIFSGLTLRLIRRNKTLAQTGASNLSIAARLRNRVRIWPALSYTSLSGYILAPLVIGHALVNRTLPWLVDGDSSSVGLGFVSHGFAKHPFVATTGYTALICVAAGHLVWGWARWLGLTPIFAGLGHGGENGKAGKRRWWVVNGVVALLAGVWMAGGLGVVGRGGRSTGWVGKGFDELFAKIPMVDF